MSDYFIIEYPDEYKVIHTVSQRKIDDAMRIVDRAMHGKLGFAWCEVQHCAFDYVIDKDALRIRLKRKYDKIKSCLKLLCYVGIVDTYTILGTGKLTVSFFKEYVKRHIHVIDSVVFNQKIWLLGQPCGQREERECHKGLWKHYSEWLYQKQLMATEREEYARRARLEYHKNYQEKHRYFMANLNQEKAKRTVRTVRTIETIDLF